MLSTRKDWNEEDDKDYDNTCHGMIGTMFRQAGMWKLYLYGRKA